MVVDVEWRVVGGSFVVVGLMVVSEDVDVVSGLEGMKEEVPMTVVDPSGVTSTTTGVGAEDVVASSVSGVGVVVVSTGSACWVVLVVLVVGMVTPMKGLAVWGVGVVVWLSVGVDEVSSAVVVVLSLEGDISGIEGELALASGRGVMTPIVKLVDVDVSEVWDDVVLSGAALDDAGAIVEECSSLLDEVIVPWCDGDAFDISAAVLDECDTLIAEDDVSCVM